MARFKYPRETVTALSITASAEPEWIEHLHTMVTSIVEAGRAVRAILVTEKAAIRVYQRLKPLNAKLDELLDGLDEIVRKGQTGELVNPPDDEINIPEAMQLLTLCHAVVAGLAILLTNMGLKKRLLTRSRVERVSHAAERLEDYLAWLNDGIDPEVMEKANHSFAEGLQELEAGETVAFL